MNFCVLVSLLVVVSLGSVSSIVPVSIAVPTVVVTTDLATTAAAVGLLKLGAAKVLALSRNRSRRSTNEVSYTIHTIINLYQVTTQQSFARTLCLQPSQSWSMRNVSADSYVRLELDNSMLLNISSRWNQ